jgi:Holliday junction resolvase RusA-like endonuclease
MDSFVKNHLETDLANTTQQVHLEQVHLEQVHLEQVHLEQVHLEQVHLEQVHQSTQARVFEFDVNFPPTSLKRHRHTKFGNHVYDPSAGEKKELLNKLLMQLPKQPFDKPIVAELYFYETRPKSHYRSGKYSNELKPNAPNRNVVKKDIDNFVKFVFDTLNKHLYVDDSQIFELKCGKYYSDREYSYICGKFAEITD